jgi:3-methyladenine DNA glycosylase AlkD
MDAHRRSAEIVAELETRADPAAVAGMAQYGIRPALPLGGTSMPALRTMARRIGRDHALAAELWATGIHEARILATLVDDPALVTEDQMERWVATFDSWDVCDQACGNLFDRTPFAWDKAADWSRRDEEFVKRAAFALMASLAVHDKRAEDARFLALLPLIVRGAADERHYVKKAVNWALRQIGKRNLRLNEAATHTAEELANSNASSARWVGKDALRQLTSEEYLIRLR